MKSKAIIIIGSIAIIVASFLTKNIGNIQGRFYDPFRPFRYETDFRNPALKVNIPCIDSDEGKYFSIKGSIDLAGAVNTDYCQDDTKITEYYCDNNEVKTETSSCEKGGCEDGACMTFTTVQRGNIISADNGVGVKFIRSYETASGEKGIELDYYIGNEKLTNYPTFYQLWQKDIAEKLQPDILTLEDFGIKIHINKLKVTPSYMQAKIESKIKKSLTSGQDLYDECLNSPPSSFLSQEKKFWPLAFLCAKYYAYPKSTTDEYKITLAYGYTVIAKNIFTETQRSNIAKLVDTETKATAKRLGYNPTRTEKPVILIDDNLNADITWPWGLSLRGLPWYSFSDIKTTLIAHELVHWFNQHMIRPWLAEEGLADYGLYISLLENKQKSYVYCNDNEIIADFTSGSPYTSYYDATNYKTGLCFWKELKENYPALFNQLLNYIGSNRTPSGQSPLLLANFIKDNTNYAFFEKMNKKYLYHFANSYLEFRPYGGDTMENNW